MTTIAGIVFSQSTTQTIHVIAAKYEGVRTQEGYTFPDGSCVTIGPYNCVGYQAPAKL